MDDRCTLCTANNVCGVCESVRKELSYPSNSTWQYEREREKSYQRTIAEISHEKKRELEEFRYARKCLLAGQERWRKLDVDSKRGSEYYWASSGFTDEDVEDEDLHEICRETKRQCVKYLDNVNKAVYGKGTNTTVCKDGSIVISNQETAEEVIGKNF